ncbi:hypothetical protein Tco_1553487 [Tanacetum coccineum]
MTKLTQNRLSLNVAIKQEALFNCLRMQKLCSAPTLHIPRTGSEDFIAYCDATKNGLEEAAVVDEEEKVIFLCITTIQKEFDHEATPMDIVAKCNYDCDIRYQPGKAKFVADSLSRKEREPPLRVRALTEAWKTPITLRVKTLGECWFVNAKFPEAIREQKVGKPRCRMAPCASMAMSWLPVMAICEHVIIARNPKNQNTLFIRVPTKCTKDREEVILGGPTRKTDIEPLMLTRKLLDRVQRSRPNTKAIRLLVT